MIFYYINTYLYYIFYVNLNTSSILLENIIMDKDVEYITIIDKDLENIIITIFVSFAITIYFSLSIPPLIEFITGEKTVRERLTIIEEKLADIESQMNHS